MDSERVISYDNFSDWINDVTQHYLNLDDNQKDDMLSSLISVSGPKQLMYLTDKLPSLLFRDFVSHLPSEILIVILKQLDYADLLSCCQVSRNWNERLDCLAELWKFKAKEIGVNVTRLSSILKDNPSLWSSSLAVSSSKTNCRLEEELLEDLQAKWYKSLYVKAVKLIKGLESGSSFTIKLEFIEAMSKKINSMMFHDNRIFIGFDDELQIWAVSDAKLQFSIRTHSICNMTMKNSTIYIASFNATVESWDANSGELKNVFWGHTKAVLSVDVSIDEAFVLTGSLDKTAKLWHQRESDVTLIATLEHTAWVYEVTFLPSQCDLIMRFITCDSSQIQLWWFNIKTHEKKSQSIKADPGKSFMSPSLAQNSPSKLYAVSVNPEDSSSMICNFNIRENGLELVDRWCVPGKKARILAVGERFMLVKCLVSYKDFFLLDLESKLCVAKINTPNLVLARTKSTVVLGDTSWLDGIDPQALMPGVPMFAACTEKHSVMLGVWGNVGTTL